MKISIIVPIYNCNDYLDKCIYSLIHQTYQNIEIILIDDGSTDNSLEKCLEYQKNDNIIMVISKENGGVSSARNEGIKKSTGKYIMFVDADDYLDLNVVSDLKTNLEKDTLIKVNHNVIYNNKIQINQIVKLDYSKEFYIKEILTGNIGGYCWGYLFEKNKIELFDEKTSYMEDTIFLINYLKKVKKIRIIDKSKYNYLFNEKSITKGNTRIIANIIDFNYSLNKIKANCKIKDIDYLITNKKLKLIESELAKINTNNIKEIFENKELIAILKKLQQKQEISIFYKVYLKIIMGKHYYIFNIYLQLRKILKKIKNKLVGTK